MNDNMNKMNTQYNINFIYHQMSKTYILFVLVCVYTYSALQKYSYPFIDFTVNVLALC